MRFWWVNQNRTHRQELRGGYLWSPKRKAGNMRNPFYETMREVAPGDLIFSFVDTRIIAIGIAQSYCYENPKPEEFGTAGPNWDNIGWRVKVQFSPLKNQVRPKDYMELLAPARSAKYAPIRADGNGNEAVYLAEVPAGFAEILIGLIGTEVEPLQRAAVKALPVAADDLDFWERKLALDVANDARVPETEREAIVRARVGQGVFKDRVSKIETRCRITGVNNPVHLVASHCKPWRDSSNEERLNGENGLLLTPSIDRLFDRGFIGFEDNGRLVISPVADRSSLQKMGVETESPINVGGFSEGQRRFLDFHRSSVLLLSSNAKPRSNPPA